MRRRTFLGVVSACSVAACGGKDSKRASGPIAAGSARDVAVGHFAFVPGQPLLLARDDRGLYAMTTICTHDDCDMQGEGRIDALGLSCDCHGSQFDRNGGVRRGPAGAPLQHYRVDLSADGSITIQASVAVGADARTPAPT